MGNPVVELASRAGRYEGPGRNAAGEEYRGELSIEPVLAGVGVVLRARALAPDGSVYHEEYSLLAMSPSGRLGMWSLNSQSRALLILEYRRDEPEEGAEHGFVFGKGYPNDRDSYRMEVTFDLWPGGDITHRFAWGVPGEEFGGRSAARLHRCE